MDDTTTDHPTRLEPRRLTRDHAVALTTVLAPAALIGILGWSFGGYYPESWGRLLLGGASAVLVLGVARGRPRLAPRERLWVGLLVALAAWQLLSSLWTTGSDGAVADAELTLVYAVYAFAFVLLARRAAPHGTMLLAAGVWLGLLAVTIGGLHDHLLPTALLPDGDRLMGERLAEPVGYANAAGIISIVGLVIVLGHCGDCRLPVRLAAFASAVPFAAAYHLSLSRGATLAAAGVLLLLAVVSAHRLVLGVNAVFLAAPVALAIVLAHRHGLLVEAGDLDAMRDQGTAYALELGGLVVLALVLGALRGRVAVPRLRRVLGRRAVGGVLSALVVAAIATAVLAGPEGATVQEAGTGSPSTMSRGLNGSLFTTGGDQRRDYWHVAARMVGRSPVLGEGAGSFGRWWMQERWAETGARNAHNLYLEMLAEVGPVGLLLIVALVGGVLAALVPGRGSLPVGTAAAGSLVVFGQALLDWDWEIPIVMLPALALGAAAIAESFGQGQALASSRRPRVPLALSCLVLVLVAVVVDRGNRTVASAEKLLAADPGRAIDQARRAERWLPWSVRPTLVLAEAQRLVGEREGSRASARRATRADPESWRAWYDLALVTDDAEQQRAAARAYALSPLGTEVRALRVAVAP